MAVIEGIDYGPLAALIGRWEGDKGMDISPEPDGTEENPYFETIDCGAAGDVTNAESQTLVIVRYHQVVCRKSNGEVFHDQIGYWLWDSATDVIVQTLAIPRAVSLQAGGKATVDGGTTQIEVRAVDGDRDWGILQSPFMRAKARTTEFRHRVQVQGDTLSYDETTVLDIYGKQQYEHTDRNTLKRH